MIHPPILAVFNKIFLAETVTDRSLTAFLQRFLTFLGLLGRWFPGMTGDVTCLLRLSNKRYANRIGHGFGLAEPGERREIPVDNSKFSTLSTGFSTGVFHRQRWLWKRTGDLHKIKLEEKGFFHFFRPREISPQQNCCAKIPP